MPPALSALRLDAWAEFILKNWALQSTLLLGLGLLAASLPRLGVATRHFIALSALILAAFCPLSTTIPHPVAARVDTAAVRSVAVVSPTSTHSGPRPATGTLRDARFPGTATSLAMVWALGCALRLLWLIGGSAQVALWLRRSRKIDSRSLAERCGYEAIGLEVRATTDLARPAVAGVLRPAILLPAALLDRPGESLRPVLLHEGAHYRRRDPLRLLLAETAVALLFWHPLAWVLRRQLDRLAEEACDREVLARGVAPGDYARTLLELLAPTTGRRLTLACSLGRAGRELQRRIDALFRPQSGSSGAVTACGTLLIVPAIAGALSIETGVRPTPSVLRSPSVTSTRQAVRPPIAERRARPADKRVQLPAPVSTAARTDRTALPKPVVSLQTGRFEPLLASSLAREPAAGQVVVFLLDISSSMRPYQEAARRDLLGRVAALRSGDTFNVVAFATEQHRFAVDPVGADDAARTRVEQWLVALPQASGTCPLPALEVALATPGAGSVVLISDRQTASGEIGQEVQDLVRERNASHATVLTVTLGEPTASGVTGIPSPTGIVERVVAAEEAAAPL